MSNAKKAGIWTNKLYEMVDIWFQSAKYGHNNSSNLNVDQELFELFKFYFRKIKNNHTNNSWNLSFISSVLSSPNWEICIKNAAARQWEAATQKQSLREAINSKVANGNKVIKKISEIDSSVTKVKEDLESMIYSDIHDIKIEIISKSPNTKLQTRYEKARSLYIKGEYEKSIQQARDVFSDELQTEFDSSIKNITKTESKMDKYINDLIQSISNMRNEKENGIKLDDLENLEEYERQAISKIAIEQILNIRNYLSILKNKGAKNE